MQRSTKLRTSESERFVVLTSEDVLVDDVLESSLSESELELSLEEEDAVEVSSTDF